MPDAPARSGSLFRAGGEQLKDVQSKWRKLDVQYEFGGHDLAEVRLQDGESIESALRRFKRKVQTEDIIKEVKRHSYYLKPGAKRRLKEALARKRARKKVRRDQD